MHLRFGHLQAEPADLGDQAPVVVAVVACLPPSGTLVSDSFGNLIGLGAEPFKSGLEQVLVDLYDVRGSWFRLLFSNRGFLFWRMKIVHRTRAIPSYVRTGIRKCARKRPQPEPAAPYRHNATVLACSESRTIP